MSTARVVAAGGLLTGAVGIGLMKAGGSEMPAVPPGAVLMVVAAVLLVTVRRRWPGAVAVLVALAEVAGIVASGSLTDLGDGTALSVAGTAVRCLGVLAALVAGSILLASRTPAAQVR